MRVVYIGVIIFLLAALVLLDTAVKPAAPPATSTYRVVDLGALEQAISSIVRGPNILGEAVGGSVSFNSITRAFYLTTDRFEHIDGSLKTDWSSSHGLNDHSAVVGSYNSPTSVRAFFWTRNGNIRDLGTLPGDSGSEAFGINKHNEVVGYSSGPRGIEAVLWTSDGKIQSLGKLRNGDHSRGFAISEAGEVVGSSGSADKVRAFIWNRRLGMQDLGLLPASTYSEAFGINNKGEVVGYASGPGGDRAFLWTRSAGLEDLGTLPGGGHSRALSINARGEVVGTSESSQGFRAFLWTRSRGMRDLNTLIPPDSDFVLIEGVGINEVGAILAIGQDKHEHSDAHGHNHEAPTRVFLLEP